MYQPEVIARAVLYAIEHPRRDLWVGWPAVKAIVGQKLIPGLLDRYLGAKGYDTQQTDALRHVHPDNLEAPVPGDRGARGEFDSQARSRSIELWLRIHRPHLAVAAAILALTLQVIDKRRPTPSRRRRAR